MKVLYVIDSLGPGGTETSTVVLASRLREMGVATTIVTLRSAEHDLTHQAVAAGVTVQCLQSIRFVARVRELRRLIRSNSFDVVHTALFRADQVGRLAAQGTGVPVVSSFVSTPYDDSRLSDPNVTRLKLRLTQFVDAVTARLMVERFHAVSGGAKIANARALRIPESRVIVAERGRDEGVLGARTEDRRWSTRDAMGFGESTEIILNLARVDHQKGQTTLIKAASILSPSRPELVVLIAGKNGSASTDVQRLLDQNLTTADRVLLLGHRTDIGNLLCAADVLVISSKHEGTAGAALEAMALLAPIVSTDVEGLHGILEHERNAILVPPDNPAALATGIARVLDDSALAARIAAQARNDFVDRFTLDVACKRLIALYESIVSRNQ